MCRINLLVLAAPLTLISTLQADLLVGSADTDSILRYHEVSGTFLGEFVSSRSGGLDEPNGFAFGPDGNFYVASHSNDSVKRYDGMTGEYLNDCVPEGYGGLDGPTGLVFGPDWNSDGIVDLYVSSALTSEILVYSGATCAFLEVFASGNGLNGPDGLMFSSDGNHLYVINNGGHNVLRFDGLTGQADPKGPFAVGDLLFPAHLVFGKDYNMYVTGHESHNVVRFNGRTGDLIGEFIPAESNGGLANPQGLTFGADGDLYVCSQETDSVKRYDGQTGEYVGNFVLPGSGGLDKPVYLLFAALPGCPGDLNGNGEVGASDLLMLLANWGVCP